MSEAFVVLLKVHLHFPDSGSLKAKRSELNAVKAHLRQRMGASVAEVAHQDSWPQGVRVDRCLASWDDLEALG